MSVIANEQLGNKPCCLLAAAEERGEVSVRLRRIRAHGSSAELQIEQTTADELPTEFEQHISGGAEEEPAGEPRPEVTSSQCTGCQAIAAAEQGGLNGPPRAA